MIQPYVYWRLNTPLAYIIGLYSNIANGGILDDPTKYSDFTKGPQYQWLVGELKAVAAANSKNSPKKAVLLMVHYPPYSGTANFNVRGDPSKGPGPSLSNAPYLSVALQKAFTVSGQRPDAIFSARAFTERSRLGLTWVCPAKAAQAASLVLPQRSQSGCTKSPHSCGSTIKPRRQ